MNAEKMNNNKTSASCRFCHRQNRQGSQDAFPPCVFCAGGKLRKLQQNAANFILRRMGFAARDSFDLHCAALKAAINNNAKAGGGKFDNNAKADAGANADANRNKRGIKNHSPLMDNRRQTCGQRFATMAAAFFGDGINAVSREEFDVHNQILAAAEEKMRQQKNKDKPAAKHKTKTGGNKSANNSANKKGE